MNDMTNTGLSGDNRLTVAMLMYPRFTLLDLVGPATALGFHSDIHLVAKNKGLIRTDGGIEIRAEHDFESCPRNVDVLFVPGGFGAVDAMADDETLAFLADRGKEAGYITSVCTGSLVQGAAGLLRGYRATTHWAWHEVLPHLGAIPVKERIVTDRNRISGGGVTAGIDFGLAVLAQLRGEEAAKTVQLMMEYDPEPPLTPAAPKEPDGSSPSLHKPQWAPRRNVSS